MCSSILEITAIAGGCVAFTLLVVGIALLIKHKSSQNKILKSCKVSNNVNLDAEDDSVKVEGVSMLAKRKYIVSEQNKIKPITYTLVDKENVVILVNDIKVVYKNGDAIEFKDGDTVCAVNENLMLSY